jgi:hypothetical protein
MRSPDRLRAPRALALALMVTIAFSAVSAVALAAEKPVKGGLYTGTLRSESITFKLARNGKSLKASAPYAPLYCQGGGAGERQISKPAKISKQGTFTAKITYEFVPTHKKTSTLTFKGKISGLFMNGSAKSHFLLTKGCDGSASFTATAG